MAVATSFIPAQNRWDNDRDNGDYNSRKSGGETTYPLNKHPPHKRPFTPHWHRGSNGDDRSDSSSHPLRRNYQSYNNPSDNNKWEGRQKRPRSSFESKDGDEKIDRNYENTTSRSHYHDNDYRDRPKWRDPDNSCRNMNDHKKFRYSSEDTTRPSQYHQPKYHDKSSMFHTKRPFHHSSDRLWVKRDAPKTLNQSASLSTPRVARHSSSNESCFQSHKNQSSSQANIKPMFSNSTNRIQKDTCRFYDGNCREHSPRTSSSLAVSPSRMPTDRQIVSNLETSTSHSDTTEPLHKEYDDPNHSNLSSATKPSFYDSEETKQKPRNDLLRPTTTEPKREFEEGEEEEEEGEIVSRTPEYDRNKVAFDEIDDVLYNRKINANNLSCSGTILQKQPALNHKNPLKSRWEPASRPNLPISSNPHRINNVTYKSDFTGRNRDYAPKSFRHSTNFRNYSKNFYSGKSVRSFHETTSYAPKNTQEKIEASKEPRPVFETAQSQQDQRYQMSDNRNRSYCNTEAHKRGEKIMHSILDNMPQNQVGNTSTVNTSTHETKNNPVQTFVAHDPEINLPSLQNVNNQDNLKPFIQTSVEISQQQYDSSNVNIEHVNTPYQLVSDASHDPSDNVKMEAHQDFKENSYNEEKGVESMNIEISQPIVVTCKPEPEKILENNNESVKSRGMEENSCTPVVCQESEVKSAVQSPSPNTKLRLRISIPKQNRSSHPSSLSFPTAATAVSVTTLESPVLVNSETYTNANGVLLPSKTTEQPQEHNKIGSDVDINIDQNMDKLEQSLNDQDGFDGDGENSSLSNSDNSSTSSSSFDKTKDESDEKTSRSSLFSTQKKKLNSASVIPAVAPSSSSHATHTKNSSPSNDVYRDNVLENSAHIETFASKEIYSVSTNTTDVNNAQKRSLPKKKRFMASMLEQTSQNNASDVPRTTHHISPIPKMIDIEKRIIDKEDAKPMDWKTMFESQEEKNDRNPFDCSSSSSSSSSESSSSSSFSEDEMSESSHSHVDESDESSCFSTFSDDYADEVMHRVGSTLSVIKDKNLTKDDHDHTNQIKTKDCTLDKDRKKDNKIFEQKSTKSSSQSFESKLNDLVLSSMQKQEDKMKSKSQSSAKLQSTLISVKKNISNNDLKSECPEPIVRYKKILKPGRSVANETVPRFKKSVVREGSDVKNSLPRFKISSSSKRTEEVSPRVKVTTSRTEANVVPRFKLPKPQSSAEVIPRFKLPRPSSETEVVPRFKLPRKTETKPKRGRPKKNPKEKKVKAVSKKKKEPKSPKKVTQATNEDTNHHWVRRSVRQPCKELLNNPHVKMLLVKLRNNDADMQVLKLKKFIGPDTPQIVMDAILNGMMENSNCQALYIQNFNEGMRDKQMLLLLEVLKQRPNIWCINIGETYHVKPRTWEKFAKGLKKTNVTHLYASEHTITSELKVQMRDTIRDNRRKHNLHIDPNNLDVIIQCTHCWWSPINAKCLRPYLQAAGKEGLLYDRVALGLPQLDANGHIVENPTISTTEGL